MPLQVVSGSTDGRLLLWDLSQPSSTDSADPVILESFSGAGLHGDCVNGVSFHPKMPVVVSRNLKYEFASKLEADWP